MSSYVEAQIDNTIQWIENYAYSPELIESVTLPDEERMCTCGERTATMPAPIEHGTYNDKCINTVAFPKATYRQTLETIRSVISPVAEQIYTAAFSHSMTPPTRMPSKLSKKRPAPETPSPSPSPSAPSHRICPSELSHLRRHRKARKTGWVVSPKATNLGFVDIGYSTRYREESFEG